MWKKRIIGLRNLERGDSQSLKTRGAKGVPGPQENMIGGPVTTKAEIRVVAIKLKYCYSNTSSAAGKDKERVLLPKTPEACHTWFWPSDTDFNLVSRTVREYICACFKPPSL